MAYPMHLPGAVREHLTSFEPKSNIKPDALGRKRRRTTRYAEYKRAPRQLSEANLLSGEPSSTPDDSGIPDGRSRSRTHPRQIRKNLLASEISHDSDRLGKYGRLVGRQSNPSVIGENTNQGGQGGNGNGVGNVVGNGIGNGNGNGTANGKPPPQPEEEEESDSDSDSEDEAGEVDTDDEEDDAEEKEEDDALPEQTQDQNKGKLGPSETGSLGLGASQTAAAVTTGASAIASTGAPCDSSTSSSTEQCEGPAPDLLQPFQKAAIATGATVSGIVALLVFAFFFMRSRHGSEYARWPCVRRYRRRKFRLNSNTDSGITILPPPPFQKEDPWTITKERESWAGRKPPLEPEKTNNYRGPSKLRNTPLVRRLLGAPLQSNPVTSPPSITSPIHPKSAAGPRLGFDPSQYPDIFSTRDNNRLTISTRSSQALPEDEQPEISDTRSVYSDPRPQNARRLPGVSYFSWTQSTPTTNGPNKYRSLISRTATSDKRETMTTVDSEPPRFRTIASWVNQQYKRANGITDPPPPPPVPKDNVSASSPLSSKVADSPLKQSIEPNMDSPKKPPLLLHKPTPPHPPIRAAALPPSIPEASPAEVPPQPPIPPVPPLPSEHSHQLPPPTPIKPRADNKYHNRSVSVSTNGTTTTPPESMHRKNASSTTSSLPTIFKHHPGDKVEINRI